ncbi:MAG: glycerate kinase [Pseudomonadota bacterium]
MTLNLNPGHERAWLLQLFQQAVRAVDPLTVLPAHLPEPPGPGGRTVVVGAGKAAARMALAVERAWHGPLEGLVVTRYGHGEATQRIRVVEAGHPVPDSAGRDAALQILALACSVGPRDLVLCLMSGGGSALLSLPAPGLDMAHKQGLTAALLRSGAPIGEMNCVRRHLSAVKGGQLGRACGLARVVTLVVSDVPGDDPAVVASGPTVDHPSTVQDAEAILRRHRIAVPEAVQAVWQAQAATPTRAPALGPRSVAVIATAQQALDAAAHQAREAGLTPLVLGGSLEGEARDVAAVHAGIARQVRDFGQPVGRPCLILSGGETTVTVRGEGRGGRNAEFLLALALHGRDLPLHAIACDTDGIDGVEDNAGAVLGPDTLARAEALGVDARECLQRNDAHHFFKALGDLVVTGPTRTNVNDFRAILVE